MKHEGQHRRWSIFLKEFDKQNRTRPTRLGEIKAAEALREYWLEDGLPLAGIDLDTEGAGAPLIEIMLGGEGEAAGRRMTHTISRARKLKLQFTADGREDGLEIEDAEGVTTILRFES